MVEENGHKCQARWTSRAVEEEPIAEQTNHSIAILDRSYPKIHRKFPGKIFRVHKLLVLYIATMLYFQCMFTYLGKSHTDPRCHQKRH